MLPSYRRRRVCVWVIAGVAALAGSALPVRAAKAKHADHFKRVDILKDKRLTQTVSIARRDSRGRRLSPTLPAVLSRLEEGLTVHLRVYPGLDQWKRRMRVRKQPLREVLERIQQAIPGTAWYQLNDTYLLAPLGAPLRFAILTRGEIRTKLGRAMTFLTESLTQAQMKQLEDTVVLDFRHASPKQRQQINTLNAANSMLLPPERLALPARTRYTYRRAGGNGVSYFWLDLERLESDGWHPYLKLPVMGWRSDPEVPRP